MRKLQILRILAVLIATVAVGVHAQEETPVNEIALGTPQDEIPLPENDAEAKPVDAATEEAAVESAPIIGHDNSPITPPSPPPSPPTEPPLDDLSSTPGGISSFNAGGQVLNVPLGTPPPAPGLSSFNSNGIVQTQGFRVFNTTANNTNSRNVSNSTSFSPLGRNRTPLPSK